MKELELGAVAAAVVVVIGAASGLCPRRPPESQPPRPHDQARPDLPLQPGNTSGREARRGEQSRGDETDEWIFNYNVESEVVHSSKAVMKI